MTYGKQSVFSTEMSDFIKDHWPTHSLIWIAKQIGRKETGVHYHAIHVLGLERKRAMSKITARDEQRVLAMIDDGILRKDIVAETGYCLETIRKIVRNNKQIVVSKEYAKQKKSTIWSDGWCIEPPSMDRLMSGR